MASDGTDGGAMVTVVRSARASLLFPILFALPFAVNIGPEHDSALSRLGLFGLVCLMFYGALAVLGAYMSRVRAGADGLRLEQPLRTGRFRWEDIDRIGLRNGYSSNPAILTVEVFTKGGAYDSPGPNSPYRMRLNGIRRATRFEAGRELTRIAGEHGVPVVIHGEYAKLDAATHPPTPPACDLSCTSPRNTLPPQPTVST